VLLKRNAQVISSIWDNDPFLQNYFSGRPVTLLGGVCIQITMEEAMENFNAALKSGCSHIIQSMFHITGTTCHQPIIGPVAQVPDPVATSYPENQKKRGFADFDGCAMPSEIGMYSERNKKLAVSAAPALDELCETVILDRHGFR